MPFKTLADLKRGSSGGGGRGGEDDDDGDDHHHPDNEYYAGGESSGQAIRGNPDTSGRAPPPNRLVSSILERARRAGAAGGWPPEEEEGEESAGVARRAFGGAGYRLGDTEGDEGGLVAPAAGVDRPTRRRTVTKSIIFYRNGFVVDDGELRPYTDPGNAEFLRDIDAGVVPRELEEPDAANWNVNLIDRKHEEYQPPRGTSAVRAFHGTGYRLEERDAAAATTSARAEESSSAPSAARPVDPTQPRTQVQVRLIDGSRLVLELNATHTVADLRQHIVKAHPEYASVPFDLQTPMPKRPLADERQTLAEAGLQNAVVLQRLREGE
ncbi:hypothetical protein CDCA_CDCA17G4472 [Cyanidium caldarium]|uniref:Uncharacterized protein n=1 Tax=Cyanidium caldarium TaxID=2771 RepID=A0AAV9J1J8_CYACA|nr:hypothetical protein CDCA_CDCA17G4472 [Cyanidium caldarium]